MEFVAMVSRGCTKLKCKITLIHSIFHYIREQFHGDTTQLQYMGIKKQLAYFLTKSLSGPLFQEVR